MAVSGTACCDKIELVAASCETVVYDLWPVNNRCKQFRLFISNCQLPAVAATCGPIEFEALSERQKE